MLTAFDVGNFTGAPDQIGNLISFAQGFWSDGLTHNQPGDDQRMIDSFRSIMSTVSIAAGMDASRISQSTTTGGGSLSRRNEFVMFVRPPTSPGVTFLSP